MEDQHTPKHGLSDWHWHVFLPAQSADPGQYYLHDSGNWQQRSAYELARDLGSQMLSPEWPEWQIVIFPDSCVGNTAVLQHSRADHEKWLAERPADEALGSGDAPPLRDPLLGQWAGDALYTLTSAGTAVSSLDAMPDADRPPAGTPASETLSRLISQVEQVVDEDGHVDRDAIMREVATMLTAAVIHAVRKDAESPGESFWFDDPGAVALIASVASTFVATYVAGQVK